MRWILLLVTAALMAGCSSGSRPDDEGESQPEFDALWDYGDPGKTETVFRDLLPEVERSGNRSHHVQLLTQIARALGLQRKFDRAHAMLDSVETMLTDDLQVAKLRYLLERGRVYNSSGKTDESKPYFAEAWDLGRQWGHAYYAVDAAHMMAIVEPPEKQLEWSEKAIAYAESADDERVSYWLGPLYNNTGWTYHDMGDYDRALELFEKSLEWRQAREDEQGTLIAKWTIARTYRSLGRIEEALRMQLDLEREREEKGLAPGGYVSEEIAECLLLLDREAEAKPYFGKAYDILSEDEWLKANEPERLNRLKKMSE
jgi:tetratricopeptide (TPR) repeat protein